MPVELQNPGDAADLQAIRRLRWRQTASFLPFLAVAAVAWWFAYHWLERTYALDDATARNLTLIAIVGFGFSAKKLTTLGRRQPSPLTPGQLALVRARRERRMKRARPWSILSLAVMLLAYLIMALLQTDWDRSTTWSLAILIAYFGGLNEVTTYTSVANADTNTNSLAERFQAIRLGFVTINVLGACLFVWNTYSPGSSSRFLPIVLLVGMLVVEVRLGLGNGPQPELKLMDIGPTRSQAS